MIEYLCFGFLGIALGTFTGLIPGIHVNNMSPLFVGLVAGSAIGTYQAISLIVAMMLTHTFLDFIPSTFLGAPNKDTALSVLPAHKLVLAGKGYEVIKLTSLGSLGALIFSAASIGLLTPFIGPAYEQINPHMHWLLIGIVAIMLFLENGWRKKIYSLLVFLLSGFLGVLVLDTNLGGGESALMPLLGGLFGLSVLIMCFNVKSSIPKQHINNKPVEISSNAKSILTGASAGFVTGIIPSIGPAQGTVLTQAVVDSEGTKDFLISVSGVNTAKALLSFVALYAIGKPRSGAAVAVSKILEVGIYDLIFLIGMALFAGGIATLLHLKIGRLFAEHIRKLPYRWMCTRVTITIIGFSFYYAGFCGILILGVATSIGLIPASLKIKRTHCMGVLILPVILYFSGLENTFLNILGLG